MVCAQAICLADPVVNTDFSKGDFKALGWEPQGAWDITTYPVDKNDPGAVARYAANPPADHPDGTLTKTFDEVKDPKKLTVSVDVGWGWGGENHAQGTGFMLVDAKGNGYVFMVMRAKGKWAVQYAPVANSTVPKDKSWAQEDVDTMQPSIRDGGGMQTLVVTRDDQGNWTFSSKNWNKGAGGTVKFTDKTTTSFTKLVLLGGGNNDELAFNKIVLDVTK
jgi:hypothetical protein